MTTTRLHFGGIPTEPDVKKLLEHFGDPGPGLLRYEQIEAAILEKRASSRFRTIVHAWRSRLLRESNIATKAEPGEGIRVMTESERVDEGRRMLGLSSRQVGRLHRWNLMVDVSKLDDIARRKHDHTLRASGALATTAAVTVKELNAALRAPAQLTRGKAS